MCYDAGGKVITCAEGQDGCYSINPTCYTKLDENGNALSATASFWSMVKDNITGLTWEVKTNKDHVQDYSNPHDADNTYTWYDTNAAYEGTPGDGTDTEDFIKQLNDSHFGGYSNWRLPTIKELANIVNYGILHPEPTIDTIFFPNTATSYYWSSTTFANDLSTALWVNFEYGDEKCSYKNYFHHVRAVCSTNDSTTDVGHYSDNGDGTVTDIATGLMWQQIGSSQTMTWEQALSYCEDLIFGGYGDWRLPTIKELRTLVDYNISSPGPTINTNFFPNSELSFYWSSTTNVIFGSYAMAWDIEFGSGDDGNDDYKREFYYVRAVRGGQSESPGNLIILSPKQADSWAVSSQEVISWNTQSIAGDVKISISRDGGKTFTTITDNTPNNGEYTWAVSGSESVNCMIKIEPLNDITKVSYQGMFTIYQQKGALIVNIAPQEVINANAQWRINGGEWLNSGFIFNDIAVGKYTLEFKTITGWTTPGSQTIIILNDKTILTSGIYSPLQSVLSISPDNQHVEKQKGITTFSVSNTGTGTMPWISEVISGGDWLQIQSGINGTDTGDVVCAFDQNKDKSSRTGTICITATGATGSPMEVTVTQNGSVKPK
jgi:hypothetical protein